MLETKAKQVWILTCPECGKKSWHFVYILHDPSTVDCLNCGDYFYFNFKKEEFWNKMAKFKYMKPYSKTAYERVR